MLLERLRLASVALCISIVISICSANSTVYAQEKGKYLIIHLDAVPHSAFVDAYESGQLPNLRLLFGEEPIIGRAVSPFPAGTETIYPRIKSGGGISDPYPLGWSYYDKASGKQFTKVEVFLKLLSYVPRRSKGLFITGVPGFAWYGGLSMLNLPQLLRRYDTVEYFWFATDFWGHWSGVEGLKQSLHLFDDLLSPIMGELQQQPLNIILYTDHGMRSVPKRFDLGLIASASAGENLKLAAYPLVYLHDPTLRHEVAQDLIQHPAIEYAFYLDKSGSVVGLHKNGTIWFDRLGDDVSYRYMGDDVLGYSPLGYAGGYLSSQEWLDLTIDSAQPAVPANISDLMQNSLISDIVIVAAPDYLPYWTSRGAHTGVWTDDLVVPVLVKGPNLDDLQLDAPFWLNTLYDRVPVPSLYGPESPEPTAFNAWVEFTDAGIHSGGMLTWSPVTRYKLSLGSIGGSVQAIATFDLYSDFVTRMWAGIQLNGQNGALTLQPVVELEITVGNFALNMRKAGADAATTSLRFQIQPRLSLDMGTTGRVGLTWTF